MPSRRKCAHTTKIERVPSYDVYHGEEDLDERLSSEGTLDLSMKKIKMEPPDEELDLSTGVGEDMGERSENDLGNSNDRGAKSDNIISMGEEERSSQDNAPPSDESETDRQTGADDKCASKQGNHSSKQSSAGEGNADEQIVIDSNGQPLSPVTGLPLFLQTSKGKSVRPFKLCTSNRDLLSGLSTQGAPSLATYSVPVALAAVPGAVPLAFASLPLVSGVPMIPGTSPPITSATSSIASTGAGSRTSCTSSTSSTTTTVGAKTTSSSTTDVHLMTLATEADKILRERHASEESSTGASSDMEGNMTGNYSSSGGEEAAMLAGEVLKIPSLAGKTGSMDMDSLTFIQKRAVEAAQSAAHPPKNKKKRMTLPETLKDIAYWERRRKNNEAAKRSRDARRAKEDQIAIRAALLEQENIRLKIEVTALKEETVKLRSMLYANNNS